MLEEYSKVVHIEALTMLDMARRDVLPAMTEYSLELARSAKLKAELGVAESFEKKTLEKLSGLMTEIDDGAAALEEAVQSTPTESESVRAAYSRDVILSRMQALREPADAAELLTGAKHWPYPTYGEMLFSVM